MIAASASALATRLICHGARRPPTASEILLTSASAGFARSPIFTSDLEDSSMCQGVLSSSYEHFACATVGLSVHSKRNLGAKPRAEAIAEILLSIKERRA